MSTKKPPKVLCAASLKEPSLSSEERIKALRKAHEKSLQTLRDFKRSRDEH